MTRKTEQELAHEAELAAHTGHQVYNPGAVGMHSGDFYGRRAGKNPALAAPYDAAKGSLNMPGDIYAKANTEASGLQVIDLLLRIEARMTRLETRVTNTLRFLGYPPRAPLMNSPKGQVILHDGQVFITGPAVTLREVQHKVSSLGTRSRDMPIILNNMLWATLHATQTPVLGYEDEGDSDEQR